MTFYYLEHKNGGWMRQHSSGKGYTWAEPQTEDPPRFFHSVRGAKAAIREWARGKQCIKRKPNTSLFGPNYEGKLTVIPCPDRSVTDWEIKEFNP